MSRSLSRRLRRYRTTLGGVLAYASLAAFWRRPPRKTFIIFGQDRTGSSLLQRLLNCSPDIYCDNEILTQKVLWPQLTVKALSMRHPGKVYGCKVRCHAIVRQGIRPKDFLLAHHERGGQIIYLRRENIVLQSISRMIVEQVERWRTDRQAYEARRNRKFYIDCPTLLRQLAWREKQLVQEQQALMDIPHLPLVYERHLLEADSHQKTLKEVFDYLGVVPAPVQARLVRTSPERLADVLENFEEVAGTITNSRYASFFELETATSRMGG